MSILRTARGLLDLTIDAVEGVLYAVFDFDRQADELWADALADKEAEEEVTEPVNPFHSVRWPHGSAYDGWPDAERARAEQSSSVADPSPEATDERRGGSIPNHDVEPPRSPNSAYPTDLYLAADILRLADSKGLLSGTYREGFYREVADRLESHADQM